MKLTVQLKPEQVAAANRIHARLLDWRLIDDALELLARNAAGFSPEATLLKVATVNSLYGTREFALVRIALHFHRVLTGARGDVAPGVLVEQMAAVPMEGLETRSRRRRSLASKFAHFFIDADRFPILDKYADRMLRYHLGVPLSPVESTDYGTFCTRFETVRTAAGIAGSQRELDRYLWLAGVYRHWRERPDKVNRAAAEIFSTGHPDLGIMTGSP